MIKVRNYVNKELLEIKTAYQVMKLYNVNLIFTDTLLVLKAI